MLSHAASITTVPDLLVDEEQFLQRPYNQFQYNRRTYTHIYCTWPTHPVLPFKEQTRRDQSGSCRGFRFGHGRLWLPRDHVGCYCVCKFQRRGRGTCVLVSSGGRMDCRWLRRPYLMRTPRDTWSPPYPTSESTCPNYH